MSDAVYIDGVLREWGDRLFYGVARGRKNSGSTKANVAGGKGRGSHSASASPASGKRSATGSGNLARLQATLRKSPEVMVKISGGGKNIQRVKSHLDYISRHGEVALEDQRGELYQGKADVADLRDDWQTTGRAIPLAGEKRREAFNIVLSMPPGTNRQAVTAAARDFAAETFSRHQYVFAAHEDEAHPHVHLCVKAVDLRGVRLNPRKADLQRWRETFAQKLGEHGIEANATPRRTRGVVRKAEPQVLRHIEAGRRYGRRETGSHVLAERKSRVQQDVETGVVSANPAADSIKAARATTLKAYQELATALAHGDPQHRVAALDIVRFVAGMPALETAHEAAVRLEKDRRQSGSINRDDPRREPHQR